MIKNILEGFIKFIFSHTERKLLAFQCVIQANLLLLPKGQATILASKCDRNVRLDSILYL